MSTAESGLSAERPSSGTPVLLRDGPRSGNAAEPEAPASIFELDVAVVGAGPLGLSLAAHLETRGVAYRLFGEPMLFWRNAMPRGLRLKSEGFASSLADPLGEFTLGRFCEEQGVAYAHVNQPVDVATFVAYGQAFRARRVPSHDRRRVSRVERQGRGFRLTLEDGESLRARRVVLATGLDGFASLPQELQGLDEDLVTHSAEHGDLDRYAGKSVVVVGAGASAADIAAGLVRAGASVTILTRRAGLKFPTALGRRPLGARLKWPMTSIGPGWKAVLCVKLPLVFWMMPAAFRTYVVRRFLGPAPAWFLRTELEGVASVIGEARLAGAERNGGRVEVRYRDRNEGLRSVLADHVIAATGYRVDVSRVELLCPELRASLRRQEGAPLLSSTFRTSVEGLYMIGPAASASFGPMCRFVCGAHFTAAWLGRHLAWTAPRGNRRAGRVRRAAGPLDLIDA